MKKILLVEDTISILNMYKAKLTMSGFTVIDAQDGLAGLQLALNEKPELIVLDVHMPKLDGLQVMKTLRQDIWGKDVPIILLTNIPADTNETIQAITDHGPAYYLIKENTTPEDLVDKVKDVLNI